MNPPAQGPARLRDVAERAGVNPATASRALSGALPGMVSPATAQRVRDAAAELGYVRDEAAASLRTGQTRTVGLLDVDSGGPLQRGVEDVLCEAGYMMITATATSRASSEAAVAGLVGRRADGVIVAGPWPFRGGALPGIPAVAVGAAPPGVPYSADPSLDVAAALAAGHLAELGHCLIACVSSPAAPLPGSLLEAAAEAACLWLDGRLKATARADSVGEGRRCCRALLAVGVPFTAILAGSDILAAGCCAELAAAGRPCPDAVSVTGAGDLPLAGDLPAPLTTVTLPWHLAGAEAARLLIARLRDPGLPAQHPRLPPGLVARRSTAPATLDDWRL